MTNANPFAQRSTLEYELPPFALIKEEHYLPAFYEACAAQLAEVQAILDTPGGATFENTIVALEKSGQYLGRVLRVFYNKSSSDTNDALNAIEEELAPKFAAHQDAISLNPVLFKRIKDLYDARESLGLNTEDAWLLERYYKDLIHKGAHLTEAQRDRLKELNEELSSLQTQFSKNVLADTNDLAVLVDSVEELDGLSENQIAAAAAAAYPVGESGDGRPSGTGADRGACGAGHHAASAAPAGRKHVRAWHVAAYSGRRHIDECPGAWTAVLGYCQWRNPLADHGVHGTHFCAAGQCDGDPF